MSMLRVSHLLTPAEERANGLLWQRDRNPEGVQRLVDGNHRFVVAQSRQFEGRGLEREDLISEGTLGLIEAAKRFNPEGRSVRFLSFAAVWVRGAMSRALEKTGQTIALPDFQQRLLWRLIQAERALGSDATTAQLAEAMNVDGSEVVRIQSLKLLRTTSADMTIGDENGVSIAAQIPAMEVSADEVVGADALKKAMSEALAALPEQQRQILELRFGMNGAEAMTLQAISDELGLSREWVRQIEIAGLAHLAQDQNLKNH